MNDGVLKISSMKDRCSPQEWQARVDLAACYRLVDLYGMSDMMANHISMRVPGEETFLINPYGMMYEEITASCLIKVDLAGNILAKPDFGELNYGINKAGYVIHSAVHEARHDVACVIHNHSWASMAVSALDCGLLPITQTAMRFLKIGYHEYEGVVLNDAEKESLGARPGQRRSADPAQPRRACRRPHRGRGVQLDASTRARLPFADRGDVVQHQAARSAASGTRRDLEQLPARHSQALRPDGVGRAAAQAGPAGPKLPYLTLRMTRRP